MISLFIPPKKYLSARLTCFVLDQLFMSTKLEDNERIYMFFYN